jgi:signal transduction histidine kinase
VTDTGIGIDSEGVQRLFQRFFQVQRQVTVAQPIIGTGLGLAICRGLPYSPILYVFNFYFYRF